MKFDKWKSTDEAPKCKSCFVAKLKNKDKIIFGEVISESGWIASSYMRNNDKFPYWSSFKEEIDCWFPVEEIGQ